MGSFCSKGQDLAGQADPDAAAKWVATSADQDHGRTFHSERRAPYVLPADIKEGGRLNLQHYLFREIFGGPNYFGVTEAQLEKGLKVLDIGCGTGIWLAEMQRDFPKGKYYGVDIVTTTWAETFKDLSSGGITLSLGNVLEKLPFEDNTFDYVHQQLLVLGVPAEKWPHVVSEVCRVLKPGGVVDLVEVQSVSSNQETPNTAETAIWGTLAKLFSARGINIGITEKLFDFVQDEPRFERVVSVQKQAPLGWGGEIGQLWRVDYTKAFLGMSPFVSAALGLSEESWRSSVENYLDDAAVSHTTVNIVCITFCAC
ncbi:S-adenosyl-L-methionine-dependent methyltransferase [Cladochytrium replicatum]|nr:S-adenosyl-L-methionine-dependent methyltransferase [Cladochytrium replicatum]